MYHTVTLIPKSFPENTVVKPVSPPTHTVSRKQIKAYSTYALKRSTTELSVTGTFISELPALSTIICTV